MAPAGVFYCEPKSTKDTNFRPRDQSNQEGRDQIQHCSALINNIKLLDKGCKLEWHDALTPILIVLQDWFYFLPSVVPKSRKPRSFVIDQRVVLTRLSCFVSRTWDVTHSLNDSSNSILMVVGCHKFEIKNLKFPTPSLLVATSEMRRGNISTIVKKRVE